MSDFDAKIVAIDSAMDAVENYQKEMSDVRAHIAFDMRSLFDKVTREIMLARNEIESIQRQIDALRVSMESDEQARDSAGDGEIELEKLYGQLSAKQAVLQDLEQVMLHCSDYGSEMLNQFLNLHSSCSNQAEEANRFMGRYIHDLNLVCNQAAPGLGTYRAAQGYYVCVLDSSLYPATAEHIRVAQNIGHPAKLIIDRSRASQRRIESLQSIPARSEFDRDEYPMAMFVQGGAGADVALLPGPDNRGAGAYISWQLRSIPDGAEVRIRVI